MPATLEIRKLPNELSIRLTEPRSIGPILLNLSVGGGLGFMFLPVFSGPARILAGGALAVIVRASSILRGADVRLDVTNLDFISTGHSPSDYRPSTISRADVYSLAFREANPGGGDFPDLPQGLYLEHKSSTPWNTTTCVLPHANEVQTEEVIEAILDLFPDTGALPQASNDKPFLTLLNLSQPENPVGFSPGR